MSQFAENFNEDEIMHQPGAQIPWRTLLEIVYKSKSHEEMLWYINATHKNGWSRAMVLNQNIRDILFDIRTHQCYHKVVHGWYK